MGDMDGGGASSWDSGECRSDAGGLAGSRALMGGGSLPPRKRLLAGLKQNGWLSTSPPSSAVSPTTGAAQVANQAVGAVDGGVAVSRSGKQDEGCMGCSVVEADGMRRIKRGGVSLRLCSSCALLYNKSMFCPHCLAMYHDASLLGDPSMWLVCCRCRRSVHPECEHKHSGAIPDASTYVCPDCVNSARRHRDSTNGITGIRSKPSSGRVGVNCSVEAGSCASAAATAECSSPSLKKPRMMRERSKPGDVDHTDVSKAERDKLGSDAGGANCGPKSGTLVTSRKAPSQPHVVTVSSHEAAAAAKTAAAVAVKAAAVAKVNAAVKASAAVKAAAAAKTALEAAAHAARAEAAARAELRRKTASAEPRLGGAPTKLEIVVHSETKRERSSLKGEVKAEKEEGQLGRGTGVGSIDDEELARQLHRVINSSPRISRSLTPMRRKASVKPGTPSSGVSNSSADAGKTWPRPGGASPSEPPQQQFKQQQTRPRSVTHKEIRRIESRVSRHEVKKTPEETHQMATHLVDGFEQSSPEGGYNHNHMEGQSAHEIASMKREAMEGGLFGPVPVQDEASILFDALVEADAEGLQTAPRSGISHDRRPDYLQEILEAAVLTDTAMSFNESVDAGNTELETVRSEAEGMGQQNQDTPLMDSLVNENETGSKVNFEGMAVPRVSGPSISGHSEEDASTALQDVEMQDVGPAMGDSPAAPVTYKEGVEKLVGIGVAGSTRAGGVQVKGHVSMEEIVVHEDVSVVSEASRDLPLVGGAAAGPVNEQNAALVSESLPQAAQGHGETWQPSKLKGSPGSSQAFASGVSMAPFAPAAQIPIRTPAFANGPAGRHS